MLVVVEGVRKVVRDVQDQHKHKPQKEKQLKGDA